MEPNGQPANISVTIINRLGLHARPAMAFVDVANAYACEIRVRKGAKIVDGKSIMSMMTLEATQGTELVIEAQGPDAPAALAALRDLINQKFHEE